MPDSQTRRREVVYVAELVKGPGPDVLEGLAFEDCTIVGPAVLIVLEEVSLVDCTFPHPDMVWPPLEIGRQYFGAIGVKRCAFHGCRFERVGLAGDAALTTKFRDEVKNTPEPKRSAGKRDPKAN